MSNIVERKPYQIDLTKGEQDKLEEFISSGLPGIASINNEQVRQSFDMYLNGASYTEISNRIGVKKVLITFLAYKHDWYQLKIDTLASLVQTLAHKTEVAHVRGFDFITDLMAALETYYRDIIDNYRRSKDKRVLESADMENVKLYMKCLEQIQKFRNVGSGDDKKGPMVNLNLPQNTTLKRIDDKTIEVSATNSQAAENRLGEVLAALAELKKMREEEKK